MTGRENYETLEKFVHCLDDGDIDGLSQFLHDDVVEEYPQSGERIRGKENWRKVYENFPELPEIKGYNIHACGYLGMVEMQMKYPDGTYNVCGVMHFSDGQVERATFYFGEPFDAPDWRSEWVEMMGDSPTDRNYEEPPSRRA